MPRKGFAGAAVPTTLSAAILSTDLSFSIASATGWVFSNGGGPFVVVIDRGAAQEEKILCSGIAGTTVTVAAGGRGYDGTTAFGHATGATVLHVLDSVTIDEANAHVNTTTRDDHTQYLRADGTRATTGIMTFGAKVIVGAGGMDVTGSPSGYTDEVRFTGGAAGSHAISTTDTGAGHMRFDHRGTGNTGDWIWGNGTGAAASQMTLSGVGLLGVAGGVDVSGSPTGYTAEVRFPVATAGADLGITTLSTGSPTMSFDHRASGNTGSWRWRNGTTAGTTVMTLSATGLLTVASLSLSGAITAVTTITTSGKVTVGAGGMDVAGSPSGYVDELRFTGAGAGGTHGIATVATGGPTMMFDHRGTGNTGNWSWGNGTGAATTVMTLSSIGRISAIATAHYFGTGALGASGAYVSLGDQGDAAGTYWIASGSAADVAIYMRTKGTGGFLVQTGGGASMFLVSSDGSTTFYGLINANSHQIANVSTPTNPNDAANKSYVDQVVLNTQTASYTAVLADAAKVVEMNVATANTFTIPPNSSVAFPIGTVIEVFQLGAGQTTITPGAGVTFRSDGGATKTAAQYATVGLRKRATDEWVLSGDLA